MKEFKDNNDTSIDKLFGDTINNLPIDASSSGWDTPSASVWNNIDAARGVESVGGNGSIATNWLFWAGSMAVLAVAGWLVYANFFSRSIKPPEVRPAAVEQKPAVVQPVASPEPAKQTDNSQDKDSPKPAAKALAPKPGNQTSVQTQKGKNIERKGTNQEIAPAVYNAPAKKEYPNNLERIKSEAQQKSNKE